MPQPLTKIEQKILSYIIDYLRRNTYQPSIREIGKRFGIKSTKTVSEHLAALAEKGYVERDASRSRGVRVLGLSLGSDTVSLPCYGKIAAGEPALLREHVTEEYTLDRKLVQSEDAFLLQVVGDSMSGVGIYEGDFVVVEPAEAEGLEDGAVVAARVGGESTVKRYFSRDGDVMLEPANTDYAPILVHDLDDFVVLGRVCGLVRRFVPVAMVTAPA